MPRRPPARRARLVLAPLAAVLALAPATGAGAAPRASHPACEPAQAGVQCGAGNGRRTAGGGEKVPHAGWPALTGILWKVLDADGHRKTGTADNDELLGHHGNDTLSGGAGHDVLWGDWDPHGNRRGQRDLLRGGAGDDWLYPSHGATVVKGGPGNDHVWAFYGHGSIDCGPGRDTVRVRMNGAFRLHGCERVQHFCAHESDGHGGCRKPGEARAAVQRRG